MELTTLCVKHIFYLKSITKSLIQYCHKDKVFYHGENGENQVEDTIHSLKIKSKDHTIKIVAICCVVTYYPSIWGYVLICSCVFHQNNMFYDMNSATVQIMSTGDESRISGKNNE